LETLGKFNFIALASYTLFAANTVTFSYLPFCTATLHGIVQWLTIVFPIEYNTAGVSPTFHQRTATNDVPVTLCLFNTKRIRSSEI
jgi:hypothetical protein